MEKKLKSNIILFVVCTISAFFEPLLITWFVNSALSPLICKLALDLFGTEIVIGKLSYLVSLLAYNAIYTLIVFFKDVKTEEINPDEKLALAIVKPLNDTIYVAVVVVLALIIL